MTAENTAPVSAAGVYGFMRSMPEAVTTTRRPPAGAAQHPTLKV